MQGIEIRRSASEDSLKLAQFFRMVITHTFHKEGIGHLVDDLEAEFESKQQILQQDFESGGKIRYVLIALDKGQIIGTIEYGPSSKLIQECTKNALQEQVEVGTVFVHPDYQGNGISHLLWNVMYLTLLSRGIKEFCFDSGYNEAQRIWCQKFGEPDYRLENYWGEGQHHMIWTRQTAQIPVSFRV